MRRPHLITPAGKYVLSRLARGWVLRQDARGFEMTQGQWRERVLPLTVLRLTDAGLAERKAGGCYELTEAGREALECPAE